VTPAEKTATERVARLRARALCAHAAVGSALRAALADLGAPTWPASEDGRWQEWVRTQGDDTARSLLASWEKAAAAHLAAIDELEELARKLDQQP
jgi:hypothetical protein